jgi:hypothetical protein
MDITRVRKASFGFSLLGLTAVSLFMTMSAVADEEETLCLEAGCQTYAPGPGGGEELKQGHCDIGGNGDQFYCGCNVLIYNIPVVMPLEPGADNCTIAR